MAEAAGSGQLPAEDVAADAAQPPTATQRFIYENRNTVAALVASFCSTIAGFPLDSVKYVVSTPDPITFFRVDASSDSLAACRAFLSIG